MNTAPGHVLQFYHLKKRLELLPANSRFLEFGSGKGMITSILLSYGFTVDCYDLNSSACEINKEANLKYYKNGSLKIYNEDFLRSDINKEYDYVISSHVIEHLEEVEVEECFRKFKDILKSDGKCIMLVPSSMKDWGIEDDVAGHLRRYDKQSISDLANKTNFSLSYLTGLTFPLSNLLLPIGNFLVRKNEAKTLEYKNKERTVISGNRENMWKTQFPDIVKYIINPVTLFPFIILQRVFSKSSRCLCIYFEFSK